MSISSNSAVNHSKEKHNAESSIPKLPPHVAQWQSELAAHKQKDATELERMAVLAAGPFHVLNTVIFRENLEAFITALERHHVHGTVYFAHKANKSHCWLPIVADSAAGIDVASGQELLGALGAGVSASRIVVTGAEKSASLLEIALRHGVLVVADSQSELLRINELALSMRLGKVRVLLRLLPDKQLSSRFGEPRETWLDTLEYLQQEEDVLVSVEGVAFHLNGYSSVERGAQAHSALDFLEILRKDGWNASILDIGGGFSIQYCNQRDWQQFSEVIGNPERVERIFHSGRGPSAAYPYGGQDVNSAAMLEKIMSTASPKNNKTLSTRLQEGRYSLSVEPGRALLDQCGISVFPIQGIKARGDYIILTVAGLSMSISEQWKGSEFLPDFTLWKNSNSGANSSSRMKGLLTLPSYDGSVSTCVGGSSCLEYDMLTWRKIPLQQRPEIGDLVIYHNTAGYQMDKNETEFHKIRLPMRFIWNGFDSLPKVDRPVGQELV